MTSWETVRDALKDAAHADEMANEGSLRREFRKNPEKVLGTFRLTKETLRPTKPADVSERKGARRPRTRVAHQT